MSGVFSDRSLVFTGPEGQNSHKVQLNGKVLELSATGELPPMPGVVGGSAGGVVEMAPLDIVFAVLQPPPAGAAAACSS